MVPGRTAVGSVRPSAGAYRSAAEKLAPACPECDEIAAVLDRDDYGLLTVVDLERLPAKVSGVDRARLRKIGSSAFTEPPPNAGIVYPAGGALTMLGVLGAANTPEDVRGALFLGAIGGGCLLTTLVANLVIWRRSKKYDFARLVRDNRITVDLLTASTPVERKLRTAAAVIGAIESSDAYASELLDSSGGRWNLDEELRSLTLSAARIIRMDVQDDDDLEAVVAAEAAFDERVAALIAYQGSITALSEEVAALAEAARVEGHSEEVGALLRSAFRDAEAARRLRDLSADTYAFAIGVADAVAIVSGSVKAIEATYVEHAEAE